MDEIYKEQLLEHYRAPKNKGLMIKPTMTKEDSNPLCGDQVEIQMRLKDNIIQDCKFTGKGCVISMASADIISEQIKGKTLEDANSITREDMLDLLGLHLTPTRVKCAMLPLITIKKCILEYESANHKNVKKTKKNI